MYRLPLETWPDWERPVGGLVVATDDSVYACDVAHQRYHTGPHEWLVVREVHSYRRRVRARLMHRQWELDMEKWMEDCCCG